MNKTWHPIALLSAALVFIYFVIFSQLIFSKIAFAVAILALLSAFIFLFIRIILGLLNRKLKWPLLQTISLALHAAALGPVLFVVGMSLANYVLFSGLSPNVAAETVEPKIRQKCSQEIALKCSYYSNDLEALTICLNNLEPEFHLSKDCTEAAGMEMTFPPLSQARQIGKALLTHGTQITRKSGRIIYIESPNVLIFGEAYCSPGLIHWAYPHYSGRFDDSKSYVQSCYLEGDQKIGGIKFKGRDHLNFWQFGTPRATFFSSSGKVSQGVLSEAQMIDGVLVKPNSDSWTYFDETGKVKSGY